MKKRRHFSSMQDAADMIRKFNENWVWDNHLNRKYLECCWSFNNRDEIDPEHATDEAILEFGNRIVCFPHFSNPMYALTVDDYLYLLDAAELESGNPIILLYRIKWDYIEVVGENEIEITIGGDAT